MWLEKDFEPASAARMKNKDGYRLLILDGHNSHCTYSFCRFAEKHKIIIICLPSHTTHVLQPCDVGVFGPLASCWKSEVNKAARGHVPITKSNLISHYAKARVKAFQQSTIKAAFRQTGIWPTDRDVLDPIVFEPSLNTTTKSAQPLPAIIPDLVPIELILPTSDDNGNPSTPTTSNSDPTSATDLSTATNLIRARFRLAIPTPLHHTASRQDLRLQNSALFDLLYRADQQIQADYAQMRLMDDENGRLRQRAYAKAKKKGKDQRESSDARHMTSMENLEKLARSDWKAEMQGTFKLIRERGKTQEKEVANHNKVLEQEKRERVLDKRYAAEMKKAEAEAEKQVARWRREMASLGKYAMEELKKSKKKPPTRKGAATRAAKSTRLHEKSECNQRAKEGETPKRKHAGFGGRRRNRAGTSGHPFTDSESSDQEYFDFTNLSPSTPSTPQTQTPPRPRPTRSRKANSDAALVANSEVIAAAPTTPAQPKPRPRPRPLKKVPKTNDLPPGSSAPRVQDKSPSTPAWHPRRRRLWDHITPIEPALPRTPSRQTPTSFSIWTTSPLIANPNVGPSEPQRNLRFRLEPIVHVFAEEGEASPPPSPTRPKKRRGRSKTTDTAMGTPAAASSNKPEPQPRRSARFKALPTSS